VHHNTDIWRFSTPVIGDPQFANWPSGLLWLAGHLWDHIEYGAGEEFVRDTALPVFRAAAAFSLDMLVADSKGELVMSPSTSPEHHFQTSAGHAATSEGAAMDQELVREVLTRYTWLVERLALGEPGDKDLAARAYTALDLLRPPAVGTDGALLEWYDERPSREPGHRHVSHLYGLYPGSRITEAGTPRDFAAARRALQTRLDHGSGYTGWSQAWILCLAARLRDPELAERSISILLDSLSSSSMLDLHPDDNGPGGWIFQIDGNFGAVAGVTELIVQSHEHAISLLKTLPASWHSGALRGIRCRGGHRVDTEWADGTLANATITTGSGGDIVVEVPGDTPPLAVTDEDGHDIDAEAIPGAITGRRRLRWSGAPHTRYRLALPHRAGKDAPIDEQSP
jgi:alpha-L-fucosidase 2